MEEMTEAERPAFASQGAGTDGVTGSVWRRGDEMPPWQAGTGARCRGAGRAGGFRRRNALAGELRVRLTPERVVAGNAVAGDVAAG